MTKVSIIGAGNLGAAIANEIATRGIVNELVLIDLLADLALGQAADIQQALPYRNKTKVYAGNYDALRDSHVIVLTAGKPRTPDIKDRLQLAGINLKIVGSIISEIKKYAPDAIIITITNPMDIINQFIHLQGFPRERVIGSGGQLDSSRFRMVLGHPLTVVEGYVLGEHGENQVPLFSRVKINGAKKDFSEQEKDEIREKLAQSALTVIQKKGATVFAPASNTADMVEAIVKDQQKCLICSLNLNGEYGLQDVSLGVPVVLGSRGAEKVEEWGLSAEELEQLRNAGKKLQEFYGEAVRGV